MTRQQLFAVCFFAGLLVLLYQIAVIFSPFVRPVLWAVILAHVTFPLHTKLTAALKGRETVSAGLLTLAIMAIVVVPVGLLITLLIQEAGSAYNAVNGWVQSGGVKRLPQAIELLPFGGYLKDLIARLVASPGDFESFLLEGSKTVSGFAVGQLAGLAKDAFMLVVNFLVIMVTLFFFFKDGVRLYQGLYRVVPLEEIHKERIFTRLDQTIRAVVKGIVITAIAQGLLAGLAYAVLDVPVPVFLMAVTIVLAPLPFGGTALVWGPVTLYLFWTGSVWKGIAMFAWGAGVVTTVDSVLRPMLIGQGAKLPVLFLFFSILGGLGAYGLIGLFLGPILLAILLTAVQIYSEEYLSEPPPPSAPLKGTE